MSAAYRVGRTVGRTIYQTDGDGSERLIGVLDTRELAAYFVDAANLAAALVPDLPPAGGDLTAPEDDRRVTVGAADLETVLNQKISHHHTRPGIWDDDNRPGLAGTWCVECAARGRLVVALGSAGIMPIAPPDSPMPPRDWLDKHTAPSKGSAGNGWQVGWRAGYAAALGNHIEGEVRDRG